uniref:Uncharacterized protein n=1 Tax=Faecalibaculum rodentium TaxID=1702221 RepID=A0A140DYI2_9FIRM|nr:hypothetical protein AALO17_25750 [Faecalibaculum rodentium]
MRSQAKQESDLAEMLPLRDISAGIRRSLKTGQEKRSKYKTIQRRFFEPEKQS